MFRRQDPSAGNRFCILIWYSVLYMHQYKQSCRYTSVFFFREVVFCWLVLNKCITMHRVTTKIEYSVLLWKNQMVI